MKNSTFIKTTLQIILIGIVLFTNFSAKAETAIDAPNANNATSVGHTSFQANWTAVKGVVGYALYVYSGSAPRITYVTDYNPKVFIGANTISATVSGLELGKTYHYVLKASDGKKESVNSNVISVTTLNTVPDAPVVSEATAITTSSFAISWNAAEGASSYKVYVSDDSEAEEYLQNYNGKVVTETSCVVSGLIDNHSHRYAVRAVNVAGDSPFSNIPSVTTKCATPVAAEATNITTTSFTANWGQVEAASYGLYVYEKRVRIVNGQLVNSKVYVTDYNPEYIDSQATSETVSGLSEGVTYYYVIKAGGSEGSESDLSDEMQVKTITAPVAIDATAITSTSFNANWEAVENIDSYALYVYQKLINPITHVTSKIYVTGYSGKQMYPDATSYTVSGLNGNASYYYALKTADINQDFSELSNEIEVKTLEEIPAAPVVTAATAITSTSFTANWEAVDGVTSYKLSVGIRSGLGMQAIDGYNRKSLSGLGTSFVIPEGTLESGKEYTYIVYAVNTGGTSEGSNWMDVTTIPAAPVATAATAITSTSFTANWEAVQGADSYELYVLYEKVAGVGAFGQLSGYWGKTVSGTSFTIPQSTLDSNVKHAYFVRAVNGSGESSNSNIINTITLETVPAAPVATAATAVTSSSFTANWEASEGATSYKLSVLTYPAKDYVAGYNKKTLEGLGTSFVIPENTLEPGKQYSFRVCAVNDAGESNWSGNISVTTVSQYTLSLSASPVAGGTVSGGGTFDDGTSVTAQATVAAGYKFVKWTKSGSIVSTSSSYNFELDANTTLVAVFEEIPATQYTLSLSAAPAAGGAVSGEGAFNEGSSVTAQATASEGYIFVNWTKGGVVVSSNASYTFTLNANTTLVANFSEVITSNTLSLSAAPVAGGTVSGGGTVNTGTSVTALATANAGYAFVNWTEGETEVSTELAYTFPLNTDRTLVANFRLTTGINDKITAAIKVWPNPASNFLSISEIPQGASFKLITMLGKVAFRKENCTEMETFDIGFLKSGIYLVSVESEKKIFTRKIIIQ